MSARTRARSFLVATAVLLLARGVRLEHGRRRAVARTHGDPDGRPDPGAHRGNSTVFAAASLTGAFDEILAEFGAANPGVTIDPTTYDGSSALVHTADRWRVGGRLRLG